MEMKEKEICRMHPECILCVIEKYITKYPEDAPEAEQSAFMQKACALISEAPQSMAIPVVVREIERLRTEMFGVEEDFTEIKRHFNALLMAQEDVFRAQLAVAEDPIMLGMQLALMGNYIDLAVFSEVSENVLAELLDQAKSKILDEACYRRLRADLEKGRKLVYLTDNCGEIVMDKLLIEQLKKAYPDIEVTVIVRGQQTMNDATMEDALQVHLDEIARVVGNGNNIMGTWLPETGEEARQVMQEADLIISKGQANFETLNNCGLNIYYLFLAKCEIFARLFQVPQMHGILVNDDELK